MIENIFKNIVYTYYPQGVCSIEDREKYLHSEEFKRLQFINNTFYQFEKNNKTIKLLMDKFLNNDITSKINDTTSLNFDRCLSYEIEILVANNKLIKVCVSISLLIPYYITYVLENEIQLNPYKWITLPKRVKEKERIEYKEQINVISSFVEEITMFNKFPEELINVIVPDLSFSDIRTGSFTLFNGFFKENINE